MQRSGELPPPSSITELHSASKPPQRSTCLLLQVIPPELRLAIYGFVVASGQPIVIDKGALPAPTKNLSLTCRLVRHEVLPVFKECIAVEQLAFSTTVHEYDFTKLIKCLELLPGVGHRYSNHKISDQVGLENEPTETAGIHADRDDIVPQPSADRENVNHTLHIELRFDDVKHQPNAQDIGRWLSFCNSMHELPERKYSVTFPLDPEYTLLEARRVLSVTRAARSRLGSPDACEMLKAVREAFKRMQYERPMELTHGDRLVLNGFSGLRG